MSKLNKTIVDNFIKDNCEIKSIDNYLDTGETTEIVFMNGYYITLKSFIDEGSYDILNIIIPNEITELYSTGEEEVNGEGCGAVPNYGFSPSQNKWYGWSHRAVYGFTIGSECKKGHVHYYPSNKEDFMERWSKFYEMPLGEVDENGFYLIYDDGDKMRMDFPKEYGKGEWVAETIEDAKQMAIDFANGVS